MARPSCCRRVTGRPTASLFQPVCDDPLGASPDTGEVVAVTLDEFEAIRLADREGLRQDEAATEMQISRPTFGRVLESAHRKVAAALVEGRALRIEGGAVCTLRGRGPRDCPRWNRGLAHGGPATCVAPCGMSFTAAQRTQDPAKATSDRQDKKEKSQ
jgi:uncharacterized protein